MKMFAISILRIFLIVLFFAGIGINPSFSQIQGELQLHQIVSSIEGLANNEQQQLISELTKLFQPVISQESLDSEILKNTSAIISAGIFEDGSINVVSDIAYKAYVAQRNGAPAAYVRDLSLIGLSTRITASQLEKAAKAIQKLMDAQIDPLVTEEFISYGIYNGWKGDTIELTADGLLEGVASGLQAKQLALTLIISIDQEISQKSVSVIVDEAINYLKTIERKKPEARERQSVAYQYLQNSIAQGLPRNVADEVYYTAIEDKWSDETIAAVFNGLIKGHQKGLPPEKLATSIFIGLAQAGTTFNPQKVVEKEIQFVASTEKKRSKLMQKDESKYKRKPTPPHFSQMSYLQPKPKPEKPSQPQYFNSTNRSSLNQQLMWQNVQEYLGPPATPYRWGGASRSGIDCSGFVRNVYAQQGIYLPRVSRQQFLVGGLVTGYLQYGDLVFFSKYGSAYQVTHVGIYLGGDKFVHSSASRGVTISSLNKGYYRLRYKGAKRVLN
ncbi:C40 family peptidase [candidate division KSB1 bacterium]|nr:C40 family peptidase [candidate division KSB1 bacterium]